MVYKSRIGYQFSLHEGDTFNTFNCSQNKSNDEDFVNASLADVELACELASNAFIKYKQTSGVTRASFLKEIALQLDAKRAGLVEQFSKESSLSTERGNAELDRTIFQLQTFSNLVLSNSWRTIAEHKSADNATIINAHFEPIGPVAVFGASNFPFAYSTIGGDTASALAVGCPVIVKAHPMHAGTSWLVAEIVLESAQKFNLPDGVFSHLLDSSFVIGEALVKHKHIKAVGFTGSIKGGRALMNLSATRIAPIPVFAEMGSLNPVVFFNNGLETNMEHWIEKFSHSIANDAGQFCTKPGLLFVPNSTAGIEFSKLLAEKLASKPPLPQLHPSIFNQYQSQVKAVFGEQQVDKPFHSKPTLRIVDSEKFSSNLFLREEFFGPQSILVFYESMDDLMNLLHLLEGQLTATMIATETEISEHLDVLENLKLKAGRIIVNGVPTGVAVCDAMVHGGAYPASSDVRFTAVGGKSVARFIRPISFQSNTDFDFCNLREC